jgi:hypothetical protein
VCLIEPLVHLPHLSLALNDVNKVALLHIVVHCLESRLNSSLLDSHLVQLLVEAVLKLLLLFLLLLEVLPELLLKGVDVFLGQLEELLGRNLLLLVEVAPELKFVLNVRDGVVDVLVDALDLLDFLGGNVLEHLQLVVLVTLETLCAQVNAVLEALVHVDKLMLGAEVADFGLIDLSGDAIHDISPDLAGVGIRYAIKGSQEVLLHIGELIQVLLCQLWV